MVCFSFFCFPFNYYYNVACLESRDISVRVHKNIARQICLYFYCIL